MSYICFQASSSPRHNKKMMAMIIKSVQGWASMVPNIEFPRRIVLHHCTHRSFSLPLTQEDCELRILMESRKRLLKWEVFVR